MTGRTQRKRLTEMSAVDVVGLKIEIGASVLIQAVATLGTDTARSGIGRMRTLRHLTIGLPTPQWSVPVVGIDERRAGLVRAGGVTEEMQPDQ